MSDLPILDELRGDLLAAMRAAEAPRRPRLRALRPVLLAALLLVLLAATAAAATYYVLRASPIAPFKPTDMTREQRVAPGTSRVLDLRAGDPAHATPPWALRLARSQTGLLCGTVGQVQGDEFGIVGLDGRFRALPEPNADACGAPDADGLALLGTRVFDADKEADVRTVVSGAAGRKLERATIAVHGGAPEPVEVGPEGAFLRAYAGFPEDLQPVVTLRFAGGPTRRYALAAGPGVIPDPLGGHAWRIEVSAIGHAPGAAPRPETECVRFSAARFRPGDTARSFGVCGRQGRIFYAARRTAGRTAVWGAADPDTVREVVVTGPGELRRTVHLQSNGGFLVILDPKVDPAALRVTLRLSNGRVLHGGPDRGLVKLKGRP